MQLKKLIISVILIVLITSSSIAALASDEREPRDWTGWVTDDNQLVDNAVKTADSAIVVDINSGRIIYSKAAYNSRYPASITKIMTCLVAIENTQDMAEIVTVDETMYDLIKQLDSQSSLSNIKRGEQISMEDLLYGLMLESGNDAAIVIASHVGGTYDSFINMMNLKAAELGMKDTHYVNPHGLTDKAHKTSARDMALLAMYSKQYPLFEKIVSTVVYTPADTNLTFYSQDSSLKFTNSNKLMIENQQYYYPYATGIKTGYTDAAEHTFVSSAEFGNQSMVAVVMLETKEGKWTSVVTLFDYAIDFYETLKISELFLDEQLTATVENADMDTTGNQLTMSVGQGEEVYITEPNHIAEGILESKDTYFTESITYTTNTLTAPINAGDQVGTVTYKYNYSHNTDDYLGYMANEGDVQYFEYTAPLYAVNAINAMVLATPVPDASPEPTTDIDDPPSKLELWQVALIAIGVLFVGLVILLIVLGTNRGGPNRRYPTGSSNRHSYDDRGGSNNRRRH